MNFTKTIPFFIILLFIQCKPTNTTENLLHAPENWRSEIIKFPLDFANTINYTGEEHIQFAPGWGDEEAKDYFTYVFLWHIDQNPKLSASLLENHMEAYFDGLMSVISKKDSEIPKAKAFFEKINDTLYVGKTLTYDAFTAQKEIKLNIIVEEKSCNNYDKYQVLFNISPQSPEHPVWKKMKNITTHINCQ